MTAANLRQPPANHPQSCFGANSKVDFLQLALKNFCLRKNIKTRIMVHDHHIVLRFRSEKKLGPLTPTNSGDCGKKYITLNNFHLFFLHRISFMRHSRMFTPIPSDHWKLRSQRQSKILCRCYFDIKIGRSVKTKKNCTNWLLSTWN
jgi:hypothetical protein